MKGPDTGTQPKAYLDFKQDSNREVKSVGWLLVVTENKIDLTYPGPSSDAVLPDATNNHFCAVWFFRRYTLSSVFPVVGAQRVSRDKSAGAAGYTSMYMCKSFLRTRGWPPRSFEPGLLWQLMRIIVWPPFPVTLFFLFRRIPSR